MFSDIFTYEDVITSENRIIYTDVIIVDKDIDWEYGDGEIEAVVDFVNGILYFGEYDTENQVYNKSKNFDLKI